MMAQRMVFPPLVVLPQPVVFLLPAALFPLLVASSQPAAFPPLATLPQPAVFLLPAVFPLLVVLPQPAVSL